MKNYVVDASVIIKWVLGDEKEPDHEKAIGLLNAWSDGYVDISTPQLWQYEVGNFLGRNLKEDASEKMSMLLDLNIKNIEQTENMSRQCFLWMKDNLITFYDASYLAVAFEVEGTLITADEKFVNKMKKSKRLCLLRDLPGLG
jgi:predicted nucleic acid-binding protein